MSEATTLRMTSKTKLTEYFDRLVGKVRARGIRLHDAEDSAAEALCKAFEAEDLRQQEAWLFSTAFHHAMTVGRRKRTAAKHKHALGRHSATIRLQNTFWEVVDELGEKEQAEIASRLLKQALATLPALDREMLEKHVVDELTCGQIAEQRGMTEAAVKGRLRRARERIRNYFALHGPDRCDLAA